MRKFLFLCGSDRFETDNAFAAAGLKSKADKIVKYLAGVKNLGKNREFLCGYEAGCPGCSLYRELTAKGIKYVILAPSTIESAPVNKIKTVQACVDPENL